MPRPAFRKTYGTPRRPFEKERLDAELKLCGEYGLRCKREVWRVHYALAKIRKAARELLTLEPTHEKRLFEGKAIIRRLMRLGVLSQEKADLDHVLALKVQDFLERRLQTLVFKLGLAKSIHHARVSILQRHIRVGKRTVNVPSFGVRVESQKHIDSTAGTMPGRNKRKSMKNGGGDDDDE